MSFICQGWGHLLCRHCLTVSILVTSKNLVVYITDGVSRDASYLMWCVLTFTFSTSLVALVIGPKLVTEIHSKFVDESSMSRATPRISIRGRETRVSGLATGKSMDSWNKSMSHDTADKRSSNGMSFSDSRPEASLENNNSKTPLSEEEESKPEDGLERAKSPVLEGEESSSDPQEA